MSQDNTRQVDTFYPGGYFLYTRVDTYYTCGELLPHTLDTYYTHGQLLPHIEYFLHRWVTITHVSQVKRINMIHLGGRHIMGMLTDKPLITLNN